MSDTQPKKTNLSDFFVRYTITGNATDGFLAYYSPASRREKRGPVIKKFYNYTYEGKSKSGILNALKKDMNIVGYQARGNQWVIHANDDQNSS
uniref:Uncharacterized protein n=1 Tax=viral metagenome TaxID=1070528 RepID=A0A6C0CL26_9ZZZZ